MFSSKLLLGVFAALALVGSPARAAIDFTGLDGTYVGNYVIGLSGQTVTSRMTVTITVPENGKKATMQFLGRGSVSSSPDLPVAMFGEHTFRSNRRVTSNNALFAMYLILPPLPTKFSGNDKKFSFVLTSSVSGTPIAVAYTITANGRSIRVVGTGSLAGSPVTVSLDARKTGK